MIKGCGYIEGGATRIDDREPKDRKSDLFQAAATKSIEGFGYYQPLKLYFAMMAKRGYRHGDRQQFVACNLSITLLAKSERHSFSRSVWALNNCIALKFYDWIGEGSFLSSIEPSTAKYFSASGRFFHSGSHLVCRLRISTPEVADDRLTEIQTFPRSLQRFSYEMTATRLNLSEDSSQFFKI